MVQPLWRTVCRFFKKLKIELPYDPAFPLPGIYLKQINYFKEVPPFLPILEAGEGSEAYCPSPRAGVSNLQDLMPSDLRWS